MATEWNLFFSLPTGIREKISEMMFVIEEEEQWQQALEDMWENDQYEYYCCGRCRIGTCDEH